MIMIYNNDMIKIINVHFIMYNLFEPMKIKSGDAWIHICIRKWRA